MSYLVDTNVFLEILLDQNKKEICKNFLRSNIENLFISDFSLHSIGLILFKYNRSRQFLTFLEDVLDKLEILSLSKANYRNIININMEYN